MGPPFDHPSADVVIRSSDGADFRVLKIDLSRLSPVFDTMFNLPQALTDIKEARPVVSVSEPRDVLDVILRFCSPGTFPVLEDLDTIGAVVEAARKYELDWLNPVFEAALLRRLEDEPLRVYAFACLFGFQAVAVKAAYHCLRRPVTYLGTQQCKELQKISGADFQNVLKYRFRCADAASSYLTSWKNMSGSQCIWEKHCISCSSSKVQRLDNANISRTVALWWDKYLTKIVQDIRECTWEGELKDEDALCCYLQYKPRDCSCALKVVVDVRTFLATLRSNLSACIQQVSLFPQFWLERFSLIASSSLRFLLEVNEAP